MREPSKHCWKSYDLIALYKKTIKKIQKEDKLQRFYFPPEVNCYWNTKLKVAARIVLNGDNEPQRIEFNPTYFALFPQDLEKIMIHEVLHIKFPNHGASFKLHCKIYGGLLYSKNIERRKS